MLTQEKGINKGIAKLNHAYAVMILKKMLLHCTEENFISDTVMIEKCAEEIQELKGFLQNIGGCITDDTLYSMKIILQGSIKFYNYYKDNWFNKSGNSLTWF